MKNIAQIVGEAKPHFSTLMNQQKLIYLIRDALIHVDMFKKNTDHYRVTKFSQGIVHISVSTAAFATQIRHQSTKLLEHIRQELPKEDIHAIQCKVGSFTKGESAIPYRKNQAKPMSPETKEKLLQFLLSSRSR